MIHLVNFICKPSIDLYVNLTSYNAISTKPPIIGFSNTFHEKFIDKYKIGVSFSLKSVLFDSIDLTFKVTRWNNENAPKFVKDKT